MSKTSWLKQYYPVDVFAPTTDIERIRHSILKWTGLTPKALTAHKCVIDDDVDVSCNKKLVLEIGPKSCALCVYYYPRCEGCPIVKTTSYLCDTHHPRVGNRKNCNPWQTWLNTGNPNPMIALLKLVEKAYKKYEKANQTTPRKTKKERP